MSRTGAIATIFILYAVAATFIAGLIRWPVITLAIVLSTALIGMTLALYMLFRIG